MVLTVDHRTKPGVAVFVIAAPLLCMLAAEDVGFRDAGEIGAAAHGLGVAHPTGFCVDLLLLKIAEYLPLGHLAFRQNIAVALEAAFVLALVAELTAEVARSVGVSSAVDRSIGVGVAVCALGGWATFLETALSVEVYTLALLAALYCARAALGSGRQASTCFVIIGLSPGLHVTAGLYALLIGCVVLAYHPRRLRFVRGGLPALLAGALCLAYLPLSAHRKPLLDWGDPTTLPRMLDHLTAARIRQAFHDEMWHADAVSGSALIDQFAPLVALLPAVLVAFVRAGRKRLLAVAILGGAAADLFYALRVNPMGIGDRQVGHLAGTSLVVLAGVGTSVGCAVLAEHRRGLALAGRLAGVALAVFQLTRLDAGVLRDGYAASELLGSGGSLPDLPARSTVVCWSDDGCATASFALYAERARPDMAVVPAQHLWDPTIRRRLGNLSAIARFRGEPPAGHRAEVSRAVLQELLAANERPIWLESHGPLVAAGITTPVSATQSPPWTRLSVTPDRHAERLEPAVMRLDVMRAARFAPSGPRAPRARDAWSSAYDELAATSLGTRIAVEAARRATTIAPERAAAFTNLGVALEHIGDVRGAITAVLRAIELEPKRPTAWVNLARMQLARGDRGGAQMTLATAERLGIEDPRLAPLAAALDSVQH